MKKAFKNRKSLRGVRIQITAHNIQHGDRGAPASCPIALAIGRTLGLASVSVSGRRVSLSSNGDISSTETYLLPLRAKYFVTDFDHQKPVKPFSFALGKKAR